MIGKVITKKVNEGLVVQEVEVNDFRVLQKLVGGYIQTVPFTKDILVVCDEEGLIKGLEEHLFINGHIIVGDIAFISHDDEDFVGLSDAQIGKIKEVFHYL